MALLRRSSFERRTDVAIAERDLDEALASIYLIADPALAQNIKEQIAGSRLDCQIRKNIDDGETTSILEQCRALMSYAEASRFISTLGRAIRLLLKEIEPDPIPKALRDVAETFLTLGESYIETRPAGDEKGGILITYLASVSRKLDCSSLSRRTVGLYRSAAELPQTYSAEFYSQAADVVLRFGKFLSKEGRSDEADRLFEDAVRWYERAFEVLELDPSAISESFLLVVCHSKLGEAYLRMRSGVLGPSFAATKAIHHLDIARDLGNGTAELLGLLGDAYYRRGYARSNKADLLKAVEFKLGAQDGGHQSRENWSVLARLYHRLFELDGDVSLLTKAFDAALTAHIQFPNWPWPLFQIAELAILSAGVKAAALKKVSKAVDDQAFLEALERGDRTHFMKVGAKLAINTTEFRRRVLGGRSGVFVLEDPHRLLSTTMVLKPTTEPNAEAEIKATVQFGAHIQSLGYSKKYSVPSPIGIIELKDDTVIYAMERARAGPLASIFLGESELGYQGKTEELTDTLDLLSLYHQWNGPRPPDQRRRLRIVSEFGNLLDRFGLSESKRKRGVDLFELHPVLLTPA